MEPLRQALTPVGSASSLSSQLPTGRRLMRRFCSGVTKFCRISSLFYTVQTTGVLTVCLFMLINFNATQPYVVMNGDSLPDSQSNDSVSNAARVTSSVTTTRLPSTSRSNVIDDDASVRLDVTTVNDTESRSCRESFLRNYEEYCNKSRWKAAEVDQQLNEMGLPMCPCVPKNLIGKTNAISMQDVPYRAIEATQPGIKPGGRWSPSGECIARQRVAIIIPFRDRESHLRIFLKHTHPILQRQLLDYRIFVVEQISNRKLFNKGVLMNAGFKESQKFGQFDCFIFHDIDMLPEDDHNFYTCANLPRHVGAFVDKWQYNVLYLRIFGGGTAFTKTQFEKSNGYTNSFYGWGGEDDDMLNRIEAAGMTFIRYPKCVATYTMIKHGKDKGNAYNPKSNSVWKPSARRIYQKDGVKQVANFYHLVGVEIRPLFTLIRLDVK